MDFIVFLLLEFSISDVFFVIAEFFKACAVIFLGYILIVERGFLLSKKIREEGSSLLRESRAGRDQVITRSKIEAQHCEAAASEAID